ncbi:MAG: hypothetical protein AAFR38_02350 [Planctomycetota bacterium]
MPLRIGELLVKRGVITEAQRDEILAAQRRRARPFGVLAEEMFGVRPEAVEEAWVEQYAGMAERISAPEIEPERRALLEVDRRQAWQFGLIPLSFDGDDLVVLSSDAMLVRALRFAAWRIPAACRFVLTDEETLREAVSVYYPMAGFDGNFMAEVDARALAQD